MCLNQPDTTDYTLLMKQMARYIQVCFVQSVTLGQSNNSTHPSEGLLKSISCSLVKIRTSCFFLLAKHVFEQFVMPPNKKLKADRHIANVERGFSAQNLICTNQRGNFLHFQCLKLLLLFDLYFLTIFWSHLLFEVPFSPRKHFFHFIIILQNFQVYFFSILYCLRHRTQVSYHLGIDTGITCEVVKL